MEFLYDCLLPFFVDGRGGQVHRVECARSITRLLTFDVDVEIGRTDLTFAEGE
jgi:hypothetical protein